MFDIRELQIVTALARHRHFGRAARECGLTQPAFSMRIRAMEEKLGSPIVRRGNRFQGLTAQGETIVTHARLVLDEMRSLEEEVRATRGEVTGSLVLGVVPTAATWAARLTVPLFEMYPGIVARIATASSLAIQSGIDDGSIDAGLTYADGVPGDLMVAEPLYDEHYVLLAPRALVAENRKSITWAEAAELPLSLLEPGMANRRILDRTFEDAGSSPRVISETNALTTTMVMAREGVAATVVPSILVETLGQPVGTVVLRLVDPELTKVIALVTPSRAPSRPTIEALREACRKLIGG
jgi:DNA-binding transcriptional LysR family regulator